RMICSGVCRFRFIRVLLPSRAVVDSHNNWIRFRGSAHLVDKAIEFISTHESVDPEKPWLCFLAFGACHAPHHVWPEWIEKYRGKFDMGWDRYREIVLERQ